MNQKVARSPAFAPVVIFAFNRPDHLKQCIDSILLNKESEFTEFWVFVDGPRNAIDKIKVREVVQILDKYKAYKNWHFQFSERNLGLAKSIISGLNKVFEKSERAIIVEDDLVASPYFLEYCNFGLEKYEMDQRVASLHGFSYEFNKPEKSPYFLRGADCWGWATWKNRWELFEEDSNNLISQIKAKRLKRKFDLDDVYPYYNMLIRQSRGEVSSWAIRWHASMFLANKLTLYPNKTLINNNGIDGSGTHAGQSKSFNSLLADRPIDFANIEIREYRRVRRKLKRFLRNHYAIRYKFSPLRIGHGLIRRLIQIFTR